MREVKLRLLECAECSDLIMCPIQCEESAEHSLGHWTLLVVAKERSETVGRYYRTLNELKEVCYRKAAEILEVIGLLPPKRTNRFMQKEAECAEVVMHHTEMEVRRM